MKLYNNKQWLYKRYILEKKSLFDMAKEANCSHMTIKRYLSKYGMI